MFIVGTMAMTVFSYFMSEFNVIVLGSLFMLALFILQGAWEWTAFMKMTSVAKRGLYVAIVAVGLAASWMVLRDESSSLMAIPVLSLFWWLLAPIVTRRNR